MKKLQLKGKMELNKKTIVNLNDSLMEHVKAGGIISGPGGFTCTIYYSDPDDNCPRTSRNLLLCVTDGTVCY